MSMPRKKEPQPSVSELITLEEAIRIIGNKSLTTAALAKLLKDWMPTFRINHRRMIEKKKFWAIYEAFGPEWH